MRVCLPVLGLLSMATWSVWSAAAPPEPRTGKDVVEQVCAACHATGAHGAPKIGDAHAWERLSARGLTSLTESAIKGTREVRAHSGSPGQWRVNEARAQWRVGYMPARGGNPGLSDLEIKRGITYMVNASGGHWEEPPAPPQ